MRDYGKVSPQFWTGDTGKALKKAGPEAVIVAMYLITSPHANMIGLYYLPMLYLAHETGLGNEGASKGLERAIEAGFCTYDEASEHVFVHAMARFQIGEQLDAKDKRCKGVENELAKTPKGALRLAFTKMYRVAFHLAEPPKEEAPSKPLASQEQEQEQEKEKEQEKKEHGASPHGSRLPADWKLPDDLRAWARQERTDLNIDREAASFADYWHGVAGAKARKTDWPATWRNWIRRADGPRKGHQQEPAQLPRLQA